MAKPDALPDGSVNLMVWQCTIPGKTGVSFVDSVLILLLYLPRSFCRRFEMLYVYVVVWYFELIFYGQV